ISLRDGTVSRHSETQALSHPETDSQARSILTSTRLHPESPEPIPLSGRGGVGEGPAPLPSRDSQKILASGRLGRAGSSVSPTFDNQVRSHPEGSASEWVLAEGVAAETYGVSPLAVVDHALTRAASRLRLPVPASVWRLPPGSQQHQCC